MGLIGWFNSVGLAAVGIAVTLWFVQLHAAGMFVGFLGISMLVAAGALEWRKRRSLIPQTSAPLDRPVIVVADVGKIELRTPASTLTRAHMRIRLENVGAAAGVLRRVVGKYTMIASPLTQEKAEASNTGIPGQMALQLWNSSIVLAPSRTVDTDPFYLPLNIRLIAYDNSYATPVQDGPEQLFLFLTVEYEDLNGRAWKSDSCWTYDHPSYGTFVRYGKQDWNREIEV